MNDTLKKLLSNLQKPMVHLGGTGKEQLAEQYQKSAAMLDEAVTAMCHASPHMRDYYRYPDADAAFAKAKEEHQKRIDAVIGVVRELQALAVYARRGGKVED